MLSNLFVILLMFLFSFKTCSDFQLRTKSGSIMCGRTMDFIMPMKSQILVFNRGVQMNSMAPDGSIGLKWTSKYGVVGINAFRVNLIDEGLNEKGLTCGYLVLNDSIYPSIVSDKNNVSVAVTDFCMWLLSNFKDTDEVVNAMNDIKIWGNKVPVLNIMMGLHIPIHDSRGKNLAIEFINGDINIYDNTLGILTNDPPLPYHLQNLAKYAYISPNISATTTINNFTFKNVPNSGMNLLPGGFSPLDRFVKCATYLRLAQETPEQYDGLLLATRILDSVYVTNGMETGFFPDFNRFVSAQTLWSTIKDLTHKIFYFRNNDGVIRAVYLNKLNFDLGTKHTPMPVQYNIPFILDETPNL